MDRPFFSIIVPCCDVAPYVRACLDSVLSQQFTGWEILAGVEESKDDTEAIVREYAAKDARIKVFTGPRSGSCSASRNTGIDNARGEYVVFLDGDDTIADGSLQRIHDKIAARPGAGLYPCAMRVIDDATGKELELRDNYPSGFDGELTGVEATILTENYRGHPCPMLQITVFRREHLVANDLRCICGIRRQDSEFSPRALYLAKRVVPLNEVFYLYRIRAGAVGTSARGPGYFHGDWAVILRSLLAFHARQAHTPGFDLRVSGCWARQWLPQIFYFWFAPENMRNIPRRKRLETLKAMFTDGFCDFRSLLNCASPQKRVAGWMVCAFVRHAFMRSIAEQFFRVYFLLSRTSKETR